ncbi:unnamed protein product [marine sediment metagenome]|uniref:HTH asnC-type domain-containing protein n=1 Tax=marine sediment metagenome TaxID=412755 RepID=X1KYL1_9ZZZZ
MRMSESAVRKRVRRLERAGVIERYTVVVDPEKLGYNAMAIIGLDVVPEKRQEVVGKLTKLGEVRMLATVAGEHMITGEVWAHDNKELADTVIRKIGGIVGVTKVRTSVILERIKYMR